MASAGTVCGLEFCFVYSGDPQDWAGWTTQIHACDSSRPSQCYENTEALQYISLEVIQAQQTNGAPVVSLAPASIYVGTEYVGKRSTPGKLVMTSTVSGALTISSLVVAGINSTDFPFTDSCPSSLAVEQIVRSPFIFGRVRQAPGLAK